MNTVVIGLLGARLDHAGFGHKRRERWRPTVSLMMHDSLPVSEFVLIHHPEEEELAGLTVRDMHSLSPATEIKTHRVDYDDPWDFERFTASCTIFAAVTFSTRNKTTTTCTSPPAPTSPKSVCIY